ncbi:MAG: hypothetical protein HY909_15830 [Deltaproteobacteria bacterium]|nr:hypothetical protein [Deltaproteobacteria bacterium]
MDQFDEGERQGVPSAPALTEALQHEVGSKVGKEPLDERVGQFLPACAADVVAEETIGLAHVTDDERNRTATKGCGGAITEWSIAQGVTP